MKILYILIFSVLFFDPSHCQNGKKKLHHREVYSATSDFSDEDYDDAGSLSFHPRNTRSLSSLSEKDSKDTMETWIHPTKTKTFNLMDFLHSISEFSFCFVLFTTQASWLAGWLVCFCFCRSVVGIVCGVKADMPRDGGGGRELVLREAEDVTVGVNKQRSLSLSSVVYLLVNLLSLLINIHLYGSWLAEMCCLLL